ncbi:carbohydrate ABC transporter permease [Cellulomonas wangsupingiae]|uniref:carbohydrate ABC transporter permease n=1 Tax=Cellulomonas wangsupingiae TaxID=2968085 RepID=UPI001D0E0B65|nr:carbohydrate ABC transporter permease [Cellulomonas wangsupingiae]MCM0641040.1 carbohydrate ABC transporter permease [Cellulomonas wangsupingiae]
MVTTEATAPATTTPSEPVQRRRDRRRVNVPGGLGSLLWLAVVIVPVYWVLVTSLRTQQHFFVDHPLGLPTAPTLDNYRQVVDSGFDRYLLNSVVVTVGAVALTIAVALLAAYTITRNTSRFVARSFSVFLLGLAIPLQAAIVPIFYMITKMGLYDTLLALVLPTAAFAVPITVIILVNFLRDIPRELFESMRVDGAGEWQVLVRLVLPLSRPAIATVAIYDGLNAWNGFLFPLVLTQSPDQRVLPLALWAFQGELTINVPAVMAAVVLSALPIFLLYLIGRRQLVAGLTAGFGK